MLKTCVKHGETEHAQYGNRPRWVCKLCNTAEVTAHRRKNKQRLVDHFGGKCKLCGYAKTVAALQFHHLDPSQKDMRLGSGNTVAFERLVTEAEKCIMVCSNCHAEIHAGLHDDLLQSRINR